MNKEMEANRIFPKIIQHMKKRHSQGSNYSYALSLEEILEELNQNDVSTKVRALLDNEILVNNPKLTVKTQDGVKKYMFKPCYNIRKGKDLLALLKDHQEKGAGGILLEDIQESLPKADEVISKLDESKDIIILNGSRKKKIVYFNDKNASEELKIDEDLVKFWRNVAVEGLDESKIEEYLEHKGITSMKDEIGGKGGVGVPQKHKTAIRKSRTFKRLNEHMEGVLDEYNPDLAAPSRKK